MTPAQTVETRPLQGTPPRDLTWPAFDHEFSRTVKQGDHQLFVGPTQSGKTVLCRVVVRHRRFVVVWGTKARDSSLDAYLDEGYLRTDQWPPRSILVPSGNRKTLVRKDFNWKKYAEENGHLHLLLWPEIKRREDLRANRDTYKRSLDDAFIDGGWTIVIDEALWATNPKGLGLDAELSQIAYGAASNKVSLYLCMQRPSGMSRLIWANVSDAYVFKSGVMDDIRELAALSTADPRDVVTVMRRDIAGHKFLHVPTRGQTLGWSISQVDAAVI